MFLDWTESTIIAVSQRVLKGSALVLHTRLVMKTTTVYFDVAITALSVRLIVEALCIQLRRW